MVIRMPKEKIMPVEVVAAIKETVIPVVNTELTEIVEQTGTIVIFKVNRPLMDFEYDELEKRVRQENEKSGLKIVLAPFSVDIEIK